MIYEEVVISSSPFVNQINDGNKQIQIETHDNAACFNQFLN